MGAVAESRIREGLEKCHCFVLASRQEPLGVAIMEAMPMEVPVIVTRDGGVTELVEDSFDGIRRFRSSRADRSRHFKS